MTANAKLWLGLAGGIGVLLVGAGGLLWMSRYQKAVKVLSVPMKIAFIAFLVTDVLAAFRFGGGLFLILAFAGALLASPMWVPRVVGWGISPLLDLYTGGDEPEALKPFYSKAVALRKRGRYAEAIEEVEMQLERFPGDGPGMMLLAEIHADDLKDVGAALLILDEVVTTPGRSPAELSLALSRRADLELYHLNDIAAARVTLERIVQEFPKSEAAVLAYQRIAHLPTQEFHDQQEVHRTITVVHHEERLGLADDMSLKVEPRGETGKEAVDLVAHLSEFPDDWESRQRLAALYVEKWSRYDLAVDQLERLITTPGAPDRQVVQWLNDLADLHLKSPEGHSPAKMALERIGQKFPGTAHADQAEARIRLLGLDRRAKSTPQKIKLGQYEQNIGLKRNDPTIPDPSRNTV
jgi:tetratricopeptide (TPR) repeat protein